MQRLRIEHLTEYRFSVPITLEAHRMLLRPRAGHDVHIVSSQLDIHPAPSIRWHSDALNNSVAVATFSEPSALLRIQSLVVIEHYQEAPLDFVVEQNAVTYPFPYSDNDAILLWPFRGPVWPADGPAVERWLTSLGVRSGPIETFVLLDRMNKAIHDAFRYGVREDPGVQSPGLTLSLEAGSCRDFAALFMDACRHLGLASRFVSGYLHVPDGGLDGATHAWTEVYVPGAGWTGFDPTTGEVTGASHIAVAVAHHPEHVPPVSGSFLGNADEHPVLHVSVRVREDLA